TGVCVTTGKMWLGSFVDFVPFMEKCISVCLPLSLCVCVSVCVCVSIEDIVCVCMYWIIKLCLYIYQLCMTARWGSNDCVCVCLFSALAVKLPPNKYGCE